MKKALIVGLGNPGKRYERTRHNIGFLAVERLAERYQMSFKSSKWRGQVAEGQIKGFPVLLLKPETYMNLSGESALPLMRYFGIEKEQLLIIVDDAAIDFGALRLREQGSSGGHNGLKSIEEHLGGQNYARLRVGIGAPDKELADFVLEPFSLKEAKEMDEVIEKVADLTEDWITKTMCDEGLEKPSSNPSNGDTHETTEESPL